MRGRPGSKLSAARQGLAVLHVLFAHLNNIDSALERGVENRIRIVPDQRSSPEKAKACPGQPQARLVRRTDQSQQPFLDRVQAIAPGFNCSRLFCPTLARHLFEGPEGLFGALKVADCHPVERDLGSRFSRARRCRRQWWRLQVAADVSGDVTLPDEVHTPQTVA